jgi:serine/threonine protein phosphatase 1
VQDDLVWIRDEFLQSTADHGCTVVHGHTPVMHPQICSNRINIDTGAFHSGRLTCLVLEADSILFL